MIIAGFSGIGKSTIAKSNVARIIDLESSDFNKKDPEWYITYCKVAKRLSEQGFIVFISCHNEVRKYLSQNDIPYVVIYPSEELEYEWIVKLQKRYEKTKLEKDLKALERIEKYFVKDVRDIIDNEKLSIVIDDIDYMLEEYIDEAINMIER